MKEKILYNSSEAAEIKTLTGWVSRSGRFYGKDEHMARWDGCTHKICECGNEVEKGWIKCDSCRYKSDMEKYRNLKFEEWDGEKPIVDHETDIYFFSSDEIDDYCDDNDISPEQLHLLICRPNYLNPIDSSYWEDVLPEEGEIPEELQKRLDELNKFISTLPPISWEPSNTRTKYKG